MFHRVTAVLQNLVAVIFCAAGAEGAEAETPVLGTEPGTLRLCNDDVGVILWGPDATPTLSVGKSDVWDRRNPKPPEPVLTLAQMMEMARAGDPKSVTALLAVDAEAARTRLARVDAEALEVMAHYRDLHARGRLP